MIPWACKGRNVDQRRSPHGRPGGRGERYFRTVRGETCIPSFSRSSLAMSTSPQVGFSLPMRRIRDCACFGIGGRPGRDFSRQHGRQPARCQRIIVSARTTTSASRQLQNRNRNANCRRVTGSIRRGLIPRSTYMAIWRRRKRFSASIDFAERNANHSQRSRSPITEIRTQNAVPIDQSCRNGQR